MTRTSPPPSSLGGWWAEWGLGGEQRILLRGEPEAHV